MNVPAAALAGALIGSLLTTAGLMRLLSEQGAPLARAGHDIVCFELAPSPGRSRDIVADYRRAGVVADVIVGLTLDSTLFIPSYATTLLLGCVVGAAGFRRGGLARAAGAGGLLAGLMVLAAALDQVENLGLYLQVTSGTSAARWALTFVSSAAKWLLIAAGSLYGLGGIAASAVKAPGRT